ncbi:hypothetical protein [Salinibius halmophilus]|uniref:hypothetical protein n=1 Tax=Salinibius halmophilus TaxID=1853216 RepID=UPI000E670FCA|nr:hypothetical protein [Salinibius halmophilus]
MEMPKKIRGLAIAYYIYGAIGLIGFAGIGALDFVAYLVQQNDAALASDPFFIQMIDVMKGLIIFLTVLHVAVNVLVGWALQNGRLHMLCFITGILLLFAVPFGTILGIFTIIWLREPEVERCFSS